MAGTSVPQQHVGANELCNLLDSQELRVAEDVKELIHENLNSSREPWLLNSLVDYYIASNSEKCLEILGGIREPHDKHLFDKCNEYMKNNATKLPTLTLLGYIVRKQPSWLHKIVNHAMFSTIIKSLKTDTDVPILMSAALTVTTLLPVVPVAISNHLPDIFLVFTRLADFATKKPGNIPDIFLLHLQVSVHALFHRLYGMYPCNFLAFLRAYFNKKERMHTYESTIKPMLERVRMHPLLVTASKELEISTSRWKCMEIHDIIIECSKMSLDMIEVTSERMHKDAPYCRRKFIERNIPIPKATRSSSGEQFSHIDASDIWSPSVICGLTTPPSSHRVTPAHSIGDLTAATANSASYHAVQHHTTPVPLTQTPRDSPPSYQTEDSLGSSSCSTAKKRPTFSSLKNSLNFTLPNSCDVGNGPQSPMKKEFTSQPPLKAMRSHATKAELLSPILKPDRTDALRNGTLDRDHSNDSLPRIDEKAKFMPRYDSLGLSLLDEKSNTPDIHRREDWAIVHKESLESFDSPRKISADSITKGPNEDKKDSPQSAPNSQRGSFESYQATPVSTRNSIKLDSSHDKSTLNVDMLPHVIEQLSEHRSEDYGERDRSDSQLDREVSSITKHQRGLTYRHINFEDNCDQLTTHSLSQYMKSLKFNRMRFNSMNYDAAIEKRVKEKPPEHIRSSSCPTNFCTDSEATLAVVNSQLCDTSDSGKGTDSANTSKAGVTQTSFNRLASTSADYCGCGSTTCMSMNNLFRNQVVSFCEMDYDAQERKILERGPRLPYEDLFPFALPYTPITQCQRCLDRSYTAPDYTRLVFSGHTSVPQPMMTTGSSPKVLGSEVPLFTQISPPELLDRHIHLGGEIHTKELSHLSLTSQESVNWTHFGGMPPDDELNILRSQVQLLHMQLMFERHKREQHAQRNRRQLGKILEAAALDDENNTMKDQILLQEKEIQSLKLTLKLQNEENRRLKEAKNITESELDNKLRSAEDEVDKVKYINKQLNSQVLLQREDNNKLLQALQESKAQLFKVAHKLIGMRATVNKTNMLQGTVQRLNKELLMMGELQKKYQERLSRLSMETKADSNMQYMLGAYRNEFEDLSSKLSLKTVDFEAAKAKLMDYEETIELQDEKILQQKKMQEYIKDLHHQEVEAYDDKYHSLMKCNRQLEMHIMQLRDRLGHFEAKGIPSIDEKLLKKHLWPRRGFGWYNRPANSHIHSNTDTDFENRSMHTHNQPGKSITMELCGHGHLTDGKTDRLDIKHSFSNSFDDSGTTINSSMSKPEGVTELSDIKHCLSVSLENSVPDVTGMSDTSIGDAVIKVNDTVELPGSYPGFSRLNSTPEPKRPSYSCSEGDSTTINYDDMRPFILSYDAINSKQAVRNPDVIKCRLNIDGQLTDSVHEFKDGEEEEEANEAVDWQENRSSRSSTLMDSGIDS